MHSCTSSICSSDDFQVPDQVEATGQKQRPWRVNALPVIRMAVPLPCAQRTASNGQGSQLSTSGNGSSSCQLHGVQSPAREVHKALRTCSISNGAENKGMHKGAKHSIAQHPALAGSPQSSIDRVQSPPSSHLAIKAGHHQEMRRQEGENGGQGLGRIGARHSPAHIRSSIPHMCTHTARPRVQSASRSHQQLLSMAIEQSHAGHLHVTGLADI